MLLVTIFDCQDNPNPLTYIKWWEELDGN